MLPATAPLPGQTRADVLFVRIQDWIRERDLRPGDRIATKPELQEWAGVSKATINETVRLLVSHGHVTLRPGPGGGLFVAAPHPLVRLGQSLLAVRGEPASVADAIAVRDLLEPGVIMEAIRHRSPADQSDLEIIIGEMAGVSSQPGKFLHATWKLHRRIARITPNRFLRDSYLAMLDFIEDQTATITHDDTTQEQVTYKRGRLQVHRDLVAAIGAGDEKLAQDAIRRHALLTR